MGTPNHAEVVNQVFARGGWRLSDTEGCGRFCEAVVLALHAVDREWGHLRKNPGQNQFNGHAVDAALYRANGNTADFIRDAGGPDAAPTWGVNTDDNYPTDKWYAPDGGSPPAPGGGGGTVGGSALDALLTAHRIDGSAGRALADIDHRTVFILDEGRAREARLVDRIDALEAELRATIKSVSATAYELELFGRTVRLRPVK